MHCHDLPIPEPCHESWEAMTGDDRRRHCASCDLSVVDLSALTRDEASVLLATRGEHRCVRYEHDAAGVIRFSDSKESGDKPAKPVRPMMMGRVAPPKPPAPAPLPKPPVKP